MVFQLRDILPSTFAGNSSRMTLIVRPGTFN